ncbi:MAG: dTDP-4-dehydrorhamnose 3,5-epimerase [Gemmatimonadota bacterium]|nr:dTDP-4-dehydrorhamnose 3,5-epimerase [Gemmatimonadota bacterium]
MRVVEAELPGVYIAEPKVFADERGYFLESWSEKRYREAGIDTTFVQDNLSFSTRGVLRGLHYQKPHEQGKLVSVLLGEVFDVVVDIRVSSPTFGRWMGAVLSAENRRQLYVPLGFAHGFVVTSETALFSYKCTDYYSPADEGSVRWNDPDIGIQWPVSSPTLSPKDGAAPLLRDIPVERLFP